MTFFFFQGIPSYLWDASFFTRQGVTFLMNRLGSKAFVKLTVDDYFWNFTDPLLKLSNNLLPFLVPTDNVGILHQVSEKNNQILIQWPNACVHEQKLKLVFFK